VHVAAALAHKGSCGGQASYTGAQHQSIGTVLHGGWLG
jgi:hypothetical protein